MSLLRLGVDLGGTKIEIIALWLEDEVSSPTSGKSLFRKRVDTPQGDYQQTVQQIIQLTEEAIDSVSFQVNSTFSIRLGIGIPGAISAKTGRIKNANSTCLIGEDLKEDIKAYFDFPVTLANDANCFSLSEATDGAAQAYDNVFGVIIGTGCGGGLVVNGRVLNGINSIAGEWGHNPLPWQTAEDQALDCYCGLQGCNETFLSGSGFERHFQNLTAEKLTAKQIVALAQNGDKKAQQQLQNYHIWLAKGLASVINIFDPDAIVLGGGMSNIESLYSEVPKIWQQWVFSDQVDTVLLPPKYGDSSGVRGAAWL